MKVLFAVNDEKDAESITRVYQEEYKEIISSKTVYYFNAIIKELQKDKTYDRIVISEDLEMFSNNNYQAIDKFIFEKMDAISDEATNAEGNDIPIILLCVDRRTKNDPLLLKLFGLGLYNILVGQDRSVQKVCKLMYKPRTKKEAKLYYKVEAENVNYTATNRSTGVNESEMQNILNHYKKIGDNIPKCVQSFESIASQYSKEQIKLIIQVLPVNVKVILEENSDLYRKIMGIHGKKVLGASQLRKTDYVEKEIDTGSRLTKPVIIPTAVSTKKVTKIQSPEELKRKQERMARERAEAEARRKEQERIAREKAEAEARRKEQERIAREKAEAEARRKEQERIEKEKAEEEMKEEVNVQNVKRGRGRPRKNPVPVIVEEVPVKKKRGRPRKNPIIEEEVVEEKVQEPKKEVSSKNKKYNQNNENNEKNDKLINTEIYDDDDLLNKEISEDDDILSQFDDYDEEDNKENIDYDQLDNEDDLDYDELDDNDLDYDELDEDELDEDELEDYDDTDYDNPDEYDDTDYNELDDDTDYDESKEQDDQDYDEEGDMLPEFEDYEEEDNKSNVKTNNLLEDDKDTTLPGFDEDDDYSDDELLDDENDNYYDDYNDDDYDEDEELLDLDDDEDDETELPGFDDDEEDDETELPGLDDDEEDDETELPGLDDYEENDEAELPGLDDYEEDDEAELPGLDDNEEDDEAGLYELDDEDEEDNETELPGFDDEDNEIQPEEPIMEKQHNGSFKKINNKNYKYDNNLANSIKDLQETEENTSYNIDTDNLITSDQKIVSFVGTTKNGTSFIVNNLAELYSNKGIKTAILDLTKNKNSYYIYTNNEDELRETAHDCLEKLRTGIADGIKVNKNLSIFTSLPGEDDSLDDVTNIIQTLLENYTIVLLDCDFATDVRYFKASQEIYLVQSLDVLTIQPLTAFLRELKLKGILETNKLRIIINKNVRVNSVTDKILIGGMSVYNDPGMTYMTELFDRDTIKYTTLPFDDQVYVKYLEGLVNCRISSKGYSKNFMSSLNKLSDMVYPTISGKKAKNKYNIYSNKNSKFEEKFSENTNSTLDKMRKKY